MQFSFPLVPEIVIAVFDIFDDKFRHRSFHSYWYEILSNRKTWKPFDFRIELHWCGDRKMTVQRRRCHMNGSVFIRCTMDLNIVAFATTDIGSCHGAIAVFASIGYESRHCILLLPLG